MPQIMSDEDVDRAIRRIAHEIIERHRGVSSVALIGIRTRGIDLANSLAEAIEEFEDSVVPIGELDVRGHRDDIDGDGGPGDVATSIPFEINGMSLVLVDDVLYTGRTVRAALDAISEIGRADKIELAVLIDRGHRELPVRADYVGKNVPTASRERIAVHVPEVDGDGGVWIERGDD
ncbi:MAG: bifunctional pyr operon transcriptional regulator/uracil phosphoribosyltransferase PyrR [Acidimicrobiia bacterium]